MTEEIAIRQNKNLVSGIFKPPNLIETDFTILKNYGKKYEKLFFLDDFNMTTSNQIRSQFLDKVASSPQNIDSSCFKNSKYPSFNISSFIDLLLTNFKPSFIKTNVLKLVSLTIIK